MMRSKSIITHPDSCHAFPLNIGGETEVLQTYWFKSQTCLFHRQLSTLIIIYSDKRVEVINIRQKKSSTFRGWLIFISLPSHFCRKHNWSSSEWKTSGWMLLWMFLHKHWQHNHEREWTKANYCADQSTVGGNMRPWKSHIGQKWGGLPMECISNIYGNAQHSPLNAAVSSDQVYCET